MCVLYQISFSAGGISAQIGQFQIVEIFYYSQKEHLTISRIAKFGGEML